VGFISIAVRALVNLESLSGVETIGNLSRHRTAPVVLPEGSGYAIRFLPVLSGESLAHSYQELQLEEAVTRNLPIGRYSQRREFLKFADETLLKEEGIVPQSGEEDIKRAEIDVLLKDYIADVGGFLYAGKEGSPIKRTSCFQVGYAIPAVHEKDLAALESQFHVRFSPSRPEAQIPYNVEVSSAIYTFTFNLDISKVGIPSTSFGQAAKREEELRASRPGRVKGSLSALLKFFSYMQFGAKRSRFLPNFEPLSAVASYSKELRFVVSPGNDKGYIALSSERKSKFLERLSQLGHTADVDLFAFDREHATEGVHVTTASTIEDAVGQATAKAAQE